MMQLTDAKVRNAKPKEKAYKLSDGEGLFLNVMPSGSKYWRMKYYYAGKEKLLAIGVYPHVTLSQARAKKAEAKALLSQNKDPSFQKQEEKQERNTKANNSFEAVAREWHSKKSVAWDKKNAWIIMRRLETDIFPKIGNRPISEITAPELLQVLRMIESRGAHEVAHRNAQVCGQIFRYAIVLGKAERDPAADLKGALTTPQQQHFSHLHAEELPAFMQTLQQYHGDPITRLALQMLIHTMVRTTELREAKWEEFLLDRAEWRIPANRMKMKETHIVPLSPQVLALLEQIKQYSGGSEYLFPNINKQGAKKQNEVMSNNTMLFAIYRMGYKGRTTGHGFRSTASTILNEHGFRSDVIERQLAHAERNKIRAAYNHAEYMKERKAMMCWWSNHLEEMMQ
jgi:integrase